MDKLTSLNLSFDRILIQIVVPGLTAIFPYFILYLNHHPNAKEYFFNNQSVTITAVTLISLIAGMLLENFGGRFEIYYLDKKVEAKFSDYKEIWKRFLKLSFTHEPVGQRYLRNILLRMKFEVSMGIAMIPLIAGLLLLQNQTAIFNNCIWVSLLLVLLPFVLFLYLLFVEAPSSALLLAETREFLVEEYENNTPD